MFASSYVELLTLVNWILADFPPQDTCDAVFLYGQTPDNEQSILKTGARLFHADLVGKVVFSTGGKSVAGQPWTPSYLPKLVSLGIPKKNIVFSTNHRGNSTYLQ